VLRPGDVLIVDSEKIVKPEIVSAFTAKSYRVNTSDLKLPVAPSDLLATPAGIGSIALSWTDNSNDELRFELYRKAEGGFYQLVAEIPANTTAYTDAELDDDTTYTYKIVAAGAVGPSADSNEASATTADYDLELFFLADSLTLDFVASGNVTSRIVGGVYNLATQAADQLVIGKAGGARVRFYFSTVGSVSSIIADALAELVGTIVVDDRFTALRYFEAQNGNFILKPGSWVQHAGVTVNIQNSLVSISNITATIDNFIVANAGDKNALDQAGNYDASQAGFVTPADTRPLVIGTSTDPIVLDNTNPAMKLLWQKIAALGTTDVAGAGFLITTIEQICAKTMFLNSQNESDVITFLERSIAITSVTVVEGVDMVLQLYPSQADANAQFNLLAEGRPYINNYLKAKSWAPGEQLGLRAFAPVVNQTQNLLRLEYLSAPTTLRGCGMPRQFITLADGFTEDGFAVRDYYTDDVAIVWELNARTKFYKPAENPQHSIILATATGGVSQVVIAGAGGYGAGASNPAYKVEVFDGVVLIDTLFQPQSNNPFNASRSYTHSSVLSLKFTSPNRYTNYAISATHITTTHT
jgi:hypothetical protein